MKTKNLFTYLLLSYALCICVGVASCSKDDPEPTPEPEIPELTYEETLSSPELADLAARQRRTAARILSSLISTGSVSHDNVLLAPLNTYLYMSVLANAASGDTQRELLNLLYYDDNGLDMLNERLGLYYRTLRSCRGGMDLLDFSIDSNVKVKAGFNDMLYDHYHVRMNVWLQTSKERLIRRFEQDVTFFGCGMEDEFEIGYTTDTPGVVVLNILSFIREWETSFDSSLTAQGPFTSPEGIRNVALMNRRNVAGRHTSGKWGKSLTLPLSEDFELSLVLAPDGQDITSTAAALTAADILEMTAGGEEVHADLTIPRLSLETETSTADILKTLGLGFVLDNTDWSGLSSEEMSITAIVNKTRIVLNEEGLKTSNFNFTDMSKVQTPRRAAQTRADATDITFKVDRPFMYVLTDTYSHTPLYIGVVQNP